MANNEHINLIEQGMKALNQWRDANPNVVLDLSDCNLRRFDFVHGNLNKVNFRNSNLEWADFRWADLIGADLTGTQLNRADFHKADMAGAALNKAEFGDTNLEDANLRGAEFSEAIFAHTRIMNTDLSGARGLESATHRAPSILDFETLEKSGYLPSEFLRGCGLQDAAITAALSFDKNALAETIEEEGDYYSCFLSHSTVDEAFVSQLHADLQSHSVRCWYAPHDLKIGDRILDTLFAAIRKQEKLLLVLSKDSVASEWVRDEVEKAFAEERDRKVPVIFPIRVDDTIMNTDTAWAEKIKVGRHIGDFRTWQTKGDYDNGFKRLLRDLKRYN